MDPDQAPETISKAVASLPPEQMFELAKQMKHCILTNPHEARNMLLQNPQLSYALLQALVIMRVLDPQSACALLHRPADAAPLRPFDVHHQFQQASAHAMHHTSHQASQGPWAAGPQAATVPGSTVSDPRFIDPRLRDGPKWEREARQAAAVPSSVPFDPRQQQVPPTVAATPQVAAGIDPRVASRDPRFAATQPSVPQPVVDPRAAASATRVDPRLARAAQQTPVSSGGGGATPPQPQPTLPSEPSSASVAAAAGVPNSSVVADQEKAALIMQVLSLSDQQIAMLPPDQQESVRLLRQQLAQQGN